MTQVKLTSDKGEVLFAEVDEDGYYYVAAFDTYIDTDDFELSYPGWSVEKIIEFPTKFGAVIGRAGWNPYILTSAGWTEVQSDGSAYLVADGEPIGAVEDIEDMIKNYGFMVVYEGFGDTDE